MRRDQSVREMEMLRDAARALLANDAWKFVHEYAQEAIRTAWAEADRPEQREQLHAEQRALARVVDTLKKQANKLS